METTQKLETHQEFIERLEAIRKQNEIRYRGYIIEPTQSYCPYGGYDFYPEAEGRNDDADCSGDPAEYHYCGNVGFASTLEDAKDQIWEKVMMAAPMHQVEMNGRLYPFEWIEDAVQFAAMWNGNLHPVCNP